MPGAEVVVESQPCKPVSGGTWDTFRMKQPDSAPFRSSRGAELPENCAAWGSKGSKGSKDGHLHAFVS